jgi:hypothetical protein
LCASFTEGFLFDGGGISVGFSGRTFLRDVSIGNRSIGSCSAEFEGLANGFGFLNQCVDSWLRDWFRRGSG